MSNLNTKFNAVEDQLQAQHIALMARLGDTNAKLDALITAMGGAPPTAAITLEDVVLALQGIKEVVVDVHMDTMSIDQKMLIVRDNTNDIHLDTMSMDGKLLQLQRAIAPIDEAIPMSDKSSVVWSLYRLVDAIAPAWPGAPYTPVKQVLNQLYQLALQVQPDVDSIQHALGLVTGDATTTVLGRLGAIEGASSHTAESIGLLSDPATGTALDLLKALKALSKCNCQGDEPDSGDCSDAFDSEGMWLGPFGAMGGTNVIVAVFDAPLPAGLSFGSTFGIAEDNTELICSDWTQWQVYVGSSEHQYAESPTTLTRYPTNQWRLMEGSGPRAFSVADRGSILVTLCPVGAFTPGGGGGGDGDGGPVGQGCEAAAAVLVHHVVLGPNATNNVGSTQGGFYWFNGNDVDSGQLEISVDGVVKKTITLTPNYAAQSLGFIGSGVWVLRHIGPGYQDVYLSRCPDVQG